MIKDTLKELDILIRARYSVLYLITHEENRLEGMIADMAANQKKKFHVWTATKGMYEHKANHEKLSTDSFHDPSEALNFVLQGEEPTIFLFKDFHPFLEDPQIVRRLRDVEFELRGTYKSILLTAPVLKLPVELQKSISIVDIPLPDEEELFELLNAMAISVAKNNPGVVKLNKLEAIELARAAQGLTLSEAENAFSKAIVNDRQLDKNDIKLVIEEKRQIIRKSGVLEFYPSDGTLSDVGGLNQLKEWLNLRSKAFKPEAQKFGLPAPKGVLLLGAPGCGKSLTAKVIGNVWNMPILRLDFGSIFSGLVGSSEENMRQALKTAESVAPVVLWIDEIEKGLSGSSSGQSDSGTSTRVFGTFLTWMQEKKSQVFVIATANQIHQLPPELLRRGRFDEIFFLDLPTPDAREEIIKVHLKRLKINIENWDLSQLVYKTQEFSGSEIEHAVLEGLYYAFHESRHLQIVDIEKAIEKIVPLSVTYKETLDSLRNWAKNRARHAHIGVAEGKMSTDSRASKIEF
jgi:SpoVK/Ycf46/Vps4 family AAA+-type ATPase